MPPRTGSSPGTSPSPAHRAPPAWWAAGGPGSQPPARSGPSASSLPFLAHAGLQSKQRGLRGRPPRARGEGQSRGTAPSPRAGGTGQREGTPLGSLRGSASWLLLSPSSGTWTTTPSLPLPGGRGRVASPNLRLIFKTEHNTPSPRPRRSRRSGAQGWKWRWAVLPGAAGRPASSGAQHKPSRPGRVEGGCSSLSPLPSWVLSLDSAEGDTHLPALCLAQLPAATSLWKVTLSQPAPTPCPDAQPSHRWESSL